MIEQEERGGGGGCVVDAERTERQWKRQCNTDNPFLRTTNEKHALMTMTNRELHREREKGAFTEDSIISALRRWWRRRRLRSWQQARRGRACGEGAGVAEVEQDEYSAVQSQAPIDPFLAQTAGSSLVPLSSDGL